MTNLLNFDIHAMTEPKSREDIEALAEEALSELAIINAALDEVCASKRAESQTH